MNRPFRRLEGLKAAGRAPSGAFSPEDFPGFSARDLKGLEVYYASQLARHEAPEKRVGWQTPESQRSRFEALCTVGPLEGTKVLDVGCGLGAFYGFLTQRGIVTQYLGVDLFPAVIREAKKAHPQAKFEVRNLLSRPFPPRSFDYVFLSGVFNVKVQDNWKYMRALLLSALKQARKAVAFNVLNAEAGIREAERFTVEPRELAAFGRRLGAGRVVLLDHYHHLDLTLFLYK